MLCNAKLDYAELAVSDAILIRQVLAFYQKREDLDIGIDKEAAAYGTFLAAESHCLETNAVFRAHSYGRFQFRPRVERILHGASRKITNVLGDVPSLESLRLRFGPGATTQVQKKNASQRRKLGKPFCCSEDLVPIVQSLLEEVPAWIGFDADSDAKIVPVEIHQGKIVFVPKNAKTYRAVGPEPMLNGMLQLGIGSYIAERLKRFGVDITDQSRNQQLAKIGSVTGSLATLDLSSASDMISREFVSHVLPVDWFILLDRARTSTVELGGESIKLQKFCTMGNGFTFPLETLLFWALATTCAEEVGVGVRDVSVYGDDIIVPVQAYDLLVEVLEAVGFVVNKDKSFSTGPFRESCGADYLSGIDIRPAYLKKQISGVEAFTLHNHFVRNGFPELASIVLSYVSEGLRLFGPCAYGDGHLHDPEWQPKPFKRKVGWAGYIFDTFSLRSRRDFRPSPGDFVYPAYCAYVSEGNPRQLVELTTIRLKKVTFTLDFAESSIVDFDRSFHDRSGNLGVVLPGSKGYKRISIYTLVP